MAYKAKYKRKAFNKFNAFKAEYNGVGYDSRKEAQYARMLDIKRKASDPSERVVKVERQVKIPLYVRPTKSSDKVHVSNYFIDFRVTFADGRVDYVEVKGYATDYWRLKWKFAQKLYPKRNWVLEK